MVNGGLTLDMVNGHLPLTDMVKAVNPIQSATTPIQYRAGPGGLKPATPVQMTTTPAQS